MQRYMWRSTKWHNLKCVWKFVGKNENSSGKLYYEELNITVNWIVMLGYIQNSLEDSSYQNNNRLREFSNNLPLILKTKSRNTHTSKR